MADKLQLGQVDVAKQVAALADACAVITHPESFNAEDVHPGCDLCRGVRFTITQPVRSTIVNGIELQIGARRTRTTSDTEKEVDEYVYTDPEGYHWSGLSDECADGSHDFVRALQKAIVDVVLHR